MNDWVVALGKYILAVTSIIVLIASIFGVPILLIAAIECAVCLATGMAFSWFWPVLFGVGIVIFVALVVADAA